ncbi:hypothetical protein B0H13DRAFT_1869833 [Mycena leptocephala]|nr:hypothetical protein B0H13DRAFT_1869833 [Mycena leptocephala]
MSPASPSPPALLSSAYILLRPATRARLAAPRIRLTIAAPEEDDFDENGSRSFRERRSCPSLCLAYTQSPLNVPNCCYYNPCCLRDHEAEVSARSYSALHHPVVIVPQDTCIGGPGGGEETLSVTGTVGYVPIGVYAPSAPPPSVSEALCGCGCTNKQ